MEYILSNTLAELIDYLDLPNSDALYHSKTSLPDLESSSSFCPVIAQASICAVNANINQVYLFWS